VKEAAGMPAASSEVHKELADIDQRAEEHEMLSRLQ
jgi:hypothetical protein